MKKYEALFKNLYSDGTHIIWGAGIRGLRLLNILSELGIAVYAFGDNDVNKQHTKIAGVPCYSKQELKELEKKEKLVVIASPKDESVYEELRGEFDTVIQGGGYLGLESLFRMDEYESFFPIGHFYSLYPDLKELKGRFEQILASSKAILDIDLKESEQLKNFKEMSGMFSELPSWKNMEDRDTSPLRYRYNNPTFPPGDAAIWHCFLRMIRPSRVIEVGSGWSSAVLLDTNEYYLDNAVELKFIEPYPARLKSVLKESDRITLIESGLQQVALEEFDVLGKDDILFIDSTHVSKVGSDVNYLLFEVLPRLHSGVYVHFHDIFYPFEYPREWIERGQIWNELYVLRAFLQNNKDYEIVYFQSMMERKHDVIAPVWPLEFPFYGGSLYIRKL